MARARGRRTSAGTQAAAPPPPSVSPPGIALVDVRQGYLSLDAPARFYNPDELVGRKGFTVYDQMLADEQVQACLNLKRAAIVSPGWTVEPSGPSDAEGALAEVAFDQLTHLAHPLDDVLWELLTAIAYGFSLAELVWSPDAIMRLARIQPIAPHDLDFDVYGDGRLAGVHQMGNPSAVLPLDKFVHFVVQPAFGNPYGTSEFRAAYRSWFAKLHWTQWLSIWGEKLADAPLLNTHPTSSPPEKLAEARAVLEGLQARTVLQVPDGWDVKTLTDGRDPKRTFLESIEHFDRAIAKALLVPDKVGVVGGEVAGGSYSLGQTQLGAFLYTLGLLQKRLQMCVQTQVVTRMAAYLAPGAPPPLFKLLPLSDDGKEAVAELWLKAVQGKTQPQLLKDVNHFRALLKWPELSEEEWAEIKAQKQAEQEAMAKQLEEQPPGKTPPEGGNANGDKAKDTKSTPDDEDEKRAEASMHLAEHKGFLVALWLEPDEAATLALGTDDAEKPDDLHVTLCYYKNPPADLNAAVRIVRAAAMGTGPLPGQIGGVGRFTGSETSDGKDVVYAVPDVPGLTALRERIAAALTNAGEPPSDAHGYTPHITLAYVDREADLPAVPLMPLTLKRLSLRLGGEEVASLSLAGPSPYRRPLTPAEQRVDLAALRADADARTTALGEALADGAEAACAAIRKQAAKLLVGGVDPASIRDLAVPVATLAALRKQVQAALRAGYDSARDAAAAELPVERAAAKQRPGLIGALAEKFFRAKAFWVTGTLEDAILQKAKAVLFNAVKGDKPARVVELELDQALADFIPTRDRAGRVVNLPARLETIARTNLAEAQNEARYAVFTDPDLGVDLALQYSAILDDRVRPEHAAWDGIVKPASWWLGPPDRRPPCGFNCRCALFPVPAASRDEITPDADLPTVEFPDPGFK